jgi:flagellar basal body-associated protein FliL
MIRLLIIVFALIAALGGGAAGLVHFAIIPDFTGGFIADLVGVQGQAASVPEDAPPPPRVDPVFMQVEPMLIPVIQDGELKKNVYIALRLQMNPEKKEEGRKALERLHDLYLRALYDIVPRQYEKRDTLDLTEVRERLLQITHRAIGPDVVEDIIFISVFNR